jgi:hypothetical protein
MNGLPRRPLPDGSEGSAILENLVVIPGDRPFLGGRNRADRPIIPVESGRALGGRSPRRCQNFITRSVCNQREIIRDYALHKSSPGLFHKARFLDRSPATGNLVSYRTFEVLYTMRMVLLPKRYTPTLMSLWSAVCAASWWNPSKSLTCRSTPTMRLPIIFFARSVGSCSGLDSRRTRRRRSWNLDHQRMDNAVGPHCAPTHPAIT